MLEVGVAAGLVAYNSALNRWPPFLGYAYVPLNLALTALVIALTAGPGNLGMNDLGLSGGVPQGVALGIGLGAVITTPLLFMAAGPRTARLIADRRVAHLSGGALAYQTLLRIPLGTALAEEMCFRGALYGLLGSSGFLAAAVGSSIAFGLWHIGPTLNLVEANQPGAGGRTRRTAVAAAVTVTTAAGILLCWFRSESGGVWLPIGLHASVNSLATIASIRAARTAAAGLRVE